MGARPTALADLRAIDNARGRDYTRPSFRRRLTPAHVSDDFRDLLAAFRDAGVKFLVVGAHALAAHGVPRATGDLDVFVEPTPENASRVWTALTRFGAPLSDLDVRESDFSTPGIVAQFGLPPYRIDVMTAISGVSFEDACKDRLDGRFLDVPVSFLGREAFVRNKQASGRPKDLLDIRQLEGTD